tara:strand:- start:1471 stop:1689 length:219 start_codon:yes stop_codon:yes gene_type:complete
MDKLNTKVKEVPLYVDIAIVAKMQVKNLERINEIALDFKSKEISTEQYISRLHLLFASMQGDLTDIMRGYCG